MQALTGAYGGTASLDNDNGGIPETGVAHLARPREEDVEERVRGRTRKDASSPQLAPESPRRGQSMYE